MSLRVRGEQRTTPPRRKLPGDSEPQNEAKCNTFARRRHRKQSAGTDFGAVKAAVETARPVARKLEA